LALHHNCNKINQSDRLGGFSFLYWVCTSSVYLLGHWGMSKEHTIGNRKAVRCKQICQWDKNEKLTSHVTLNACSFCWIPFFKLPSRVIAMHDRIDMLIHARLRRFCFKKLPHFFSKDNGGKPWSIVSQNQTSLHNRNDHEDIQSQPLMSMDCFFFLICFYSSGQS